MFYSVCVSEIHREGLHRPVSGYVPEEIWKKAGEQFNLRSPPPGLWIVFPFRFIIQVQEFSLLPDGVICEIPNH